MSSDQDQSQSDMSHLSLDDNQGKRTEGTKDSSDPESSDNAMDETPDALQDGLSQPSSSAVNDTAVPSKDTQVTQSDSAAITEEAPTAGKSEETMGKPKEGEGNAQKLTKDQTLETPPADSPTQQPISEDKKSTTSQSGSGEGTNSTSRKEQKTDRKTSKTKKDTVSTKKPTLDQNANVESNPKDTAETKQKGKGQLTIYFHAVLSKDFKFDPKEDRIFIRVGHRIGTWEENAVELFVTRDLGEHGFLVEGTLMTIKSKAVSVSIPYKYVVYKYGKKTYDFEYIYKVDSTPDVHTNRCLFVKNHLINDDGDWHQYDDIICAEPSKNIFKRVKETFWPEQRNNLIKGREIAGNIMLETIFDLLRSWNNTNLRSFLIQLSQFIQVYGEPFVYEDKEKKWYSLKYGPDDVKKMLKEFMLNNMIPQLREGDGKSLYIKDPLRAAVIMLHVCRQHQIRLENFELKRLCTALCLPKLEKDNFLQYWTDFSQCASSLKRLAPNLFNNLTVHPTMPHWIMVLPLYHLLKGTTKPFEPPSSGNLKYGASWAGLQGLEMNPSAYMNSQDRKALLNVMKNRSHLMEVDAYLVRSYLYLMSTDELMECSTTINPELLDMLQVFTNKTPSDITASSFEVSGKKPDIYTPKICVVSLLNSRLCKCHRLLACILKMKHIFLVVQHHMQTKSEGKLFERLKINWKFGKLISAIIQKSWPRDTQGNFQEDEEVVLQHLLSWTAAKDVFQLHGISSGKHSNLNTPKKTKQIKLVNLIGSNTLVVTRP
uniref:Uncharacterized protein n=1 Tax=Acanthochromis polyacanthus TaxID=80966 RepID=A0A3Q1GY65_9TELE